MQYSCAFVSINVYYCCACVYYQKYTAQDMTTAENFTSHNALQHNNAKEHTKSYHALLHGLVRYFLHKNSIYFGVGGGEPTL